MRNSHSWAPYTDHQLLAITSFRLQVPFPLVSVMLCPDFGPNLDNFGLSEPLVGAAHCYLGNWVFDLDPPVRDTLLGHLFLGRSLPGPPP